MNHLTNARETVLPRILEYIKLRRTGPGVGKTELADLIASVFCKNRLVMGFNRRKMVRIKNPFWTDMSEMGVARRKKVLGRVKARVEHSATPPPEPADLETNITVSYDTDADE